MQASDRRSMLFGEMLVEWECEACRWLDFLDIKRGTTYEELEEAVCNQHNTIKPQCEFRPNKIWLTFRPAEV